MCVVEKADLRATNQSRSPPSLKRSLCQSFVFFLALPFIAILGAEKPRLVISLPLLLRRAVDRSGHRERCFCFDDRRTSAVLYFGSLGSCVRALFWIALKREGTAFSNTHSCLGLFFFSNTRKMSNVRLSNGSPTLERMEARLSDQPKPSACRNLFGPVDHEELKMQLKRHLTEMENASSDKWNFDFSTHTPRPNGRYQWEAMDIDAVPGFYSRSEREKRSNVNVCSSGINNANNVDVNGNHDCRVTEEDAETPETPRDQRKRPSCQDSSCQSKRAHTCVDEVTRTPRKPKKPRKPHSPTPT